MAIETDEGALSDGTLVRHRVNGYLGRIDGVTAIQSCFTNRGAPMPTATSKEKFQYRVIVKGEKMRRIAPVRDLEVLDAGTSIHVTCVNCQTTFASSPNAIDKPGGICECGGWICPECLLCQLAPENSADGSTESCPNQRKRLLKKAASHKRAKPAVGSKTISEPHAPKFRN
jgi:hypothetical protein